MGIVYDGGGGVGMRANFALWGWEKANWEEGDFSRFSVKADLSHRFLWIVVYVLFEVLFARRILQEKIYLGFVFFFDSRITLITSLGLCEMIQKTSKKTNTFNVMHIIRSLTILMNVSYSV